MKHEKKLRQEKLAEQIYSYLKHKSSEELLQVWIDNNRNVWIDEAFPVIKRILEERSVNIPDQNVPMDRIERTIKESFSSFRVRGFIIATAILSIAPIPFFTYYYVINGWIKTNHGPLWDNPWGGWIVYSELALIFLLPPITLISCIGNSIYTKKRRTAILGIILAVIQIILAAINLIPALALID